MVRGTELPLVPEPRFGRSVTLLNVPVAGGLEKAHRVYGPTSEPMNVTVELYLSSVSIFASSSTHWGWDPLSDGVSLASGGRASVETVRSCAFENGTADPEIARNPHAPSRP